MRLYFKSVLSTESELSKRLLSKTKIPPQIVKVSLTPVNLHLQFLNPICGAPSFPWSIFSLPSESQSVSWSVMSDSATPWTTAHQAPLSMRFSRQEYWNGLPFPSPGVLPNPGLESRSPALQADSLPSDLPGKPSLLGGVKMSGPLWSFPTSLCSSPCEHFHCITICFSFLWLLWQIIALGGLKQQKCILAVLKPRSLKLVSRGWNQGLSKTTVLLESPRGKSAPCLFQLAVEVPHARGLSPHPSHLWVSLCQIPSGDVWRLLWWHWGPTWTIQNNRTAQDPQFNTYARPFQTVWGDMYRLWGSGPNIFGCHYSATTELLAHVLVSSPWYNKDLAPGKYM